MKIENTVCCTIVLFLWYMRETVGLLTHGNPVNVTDTIHGFPGHNINLADVVELLLNQTAEIENLKQQTAEIEHLKQQTAEIENLKQQSANLKQQTTNDRSTIQSLQNRVFFLEAELNKLNVSKLPSSQEFSTYLKSINQLTQSLAANEANDKNTSQRLYNAVQALEDLKLKDMSATQLLLNQSGELKQQSAKDRYSIHLLQNETQQLSNTTQLLLTQSGELKQHSERDKSFIDLLQNDTKRLAKNLDDLKVQVRYTSLSLLDVHSMTEEVNGSLIQRFEERISDVHDQIANVSKRVGFTASVSSSSSTWNSGTLVFPVVITNVGNGYNPSTGVFTAPTAGIYVFFVNVHGYSTNDILTDIVLNGVKQVRTLSENSPNYNNAGPNVVVLTLQKEDTVWVKYYAGQGYVDNGHSTTFSGFLI